MPFSSPITPWSPAFSRALGSLVGFTLSSQWLLEVIPSFWFAVVITLVLGNPNDYNINNNNSDDNSYTGEDILSCNYIDNINNIDDVSEVLKLVSDTTNYYH